MTGRLVRTTVAEALPGGGRPRWLSLTRFRVFGWNVAKRFVTECFVHRRGLELPNLASHMRVALPKDCVEHRLQLAGRTGDDLQHLRGRSLLLKRLRKIACALTQLVKQPCVLDGNDRLSGEVLDQLDLLFSKWAYFLAINYDYTDRVRSPST